MSVVVLTIIDERVLGNRGQVLAKAVKRERLRVIVAGRADTGPSLIGVLVLNLILLLPLIKMAKKYKKAKTSTSSRPMVHTAKRQRNRRYGCEQVSCDRTFRDFHDLQKHRRACLKERYCYSAGDLESVGLGGLKVSHSLPIVYFKL